MLFAFFSLGYDYKLCNTLNEHSVIKAVRLSSYLTERLSVALPVDWR